jgi:multicomponent Na+:H+ antiporter subunit E
LGLAIILAIFWLINSGHFTFLLLSLGLLSVIGVLLIVRHMEKVDGKFEPSVILSVSLPIYLFWLLWEIIKSNIDVVIKVWKGEESISPVVFKVTASQTTDSCRVLYANSITMTPGTITLNIRDNTIEVHALSREAAEGLKNGEMDRRVSRLEGK